MPSTPEAIKDYQRRLAQLAGAHAKALNKLETEQAIRVQLLADITGAPGKWPAAERESEGVVGAPG